MLEILYLIVYFLSYAAGFSALIITLFALWKGAPYWMKTYFGFILASIFFMLIRNLGFFVKIFMNVYDLEQSPFFYAIYMISSGLMVFYLVSIALEWNWDKKVRIGKVAGAIFGSIPLLMIIIVTFPREAGNTGSIRLLLMNVIMYYAYAMVLMTLVFLLIIKRKIKKSLRRALIDSSLSVGASYFLFGSIHWLTYYKEAYSLYPFSIINISLTLLFVGSAITIGKKFVLPHPPAFGNSPPNVLIPDLADTENSIINLIQQGATNKDISEKLNLTLAKVKNINYKIFSRFGVNSRTELLLVLRNYTDPSAGPDKP